jgi:Mg2+-importing ATPase
VIGFFFHAYLNSFYEKGFSNPIDEAIRSYKQQDISGYEKVDEVPYDFIRKRLSIMIKKDGRYFMVTKGALSNVLAVCPFAENKAGDKIDTNTVGQIIQQKFEEHSNQGFRVLGVAMRDMGTQPVLNKDSERDMTLLGFLLFFDPPKKGVLETIDRLKQLGVSLKVITGR